MVRLFFDTETTGLPKSYNAPTSDVDNWPRLVQLSWELYQEDMIISKADMIIKPEGFVIPEESTKIHGITNDVADELGVSCKAAVYYLLGAAKMADVVVGHNVDFDLHIVGAELIRHWGKDYLAGVKTEDTMKASVDFCKIDNGKGGYKYPKLQELHKALFNEEFDNAHDSGADVSATVRCYWALKEEGVM